MQKGNFQIPEQVVARHAEDDALHVVPRAGYCYIDV
jgi:hypothetical protein